MRIAAKLLLIAVIGALVFPLTASAQKPVKQAVSTFDYTKNLHPLGYSPRPVPIDNTVAGSGSFNTDLAFWGDLAVQGTYAGFRLIDISSPANPVEIIDWEECAAFTNTQGNQGDVIIWENLVIRSWNSTTPASGSQCGNWDMLPGQEGVHVIDISDPTNPQVVAFVDTPCGSHTETLVPDLENNRLLVYSNSSSGAVLGGDPATGEPPISCRGIDIIEVPLDDPSAASYLRFEPAGDPSMPAEEHHPCHDTSVILGDAMLVACAGSGAPAKGPA